MRNDRKNPHAGSANDVDERFDIVDAVFEFNERIVQIPVMPPNSLSDVQVQWLDTFVREELDEFQEAYRKADIVGMVDAVVDLCYGAMGTLKKMGLTRAQATACWVAVHSANMSKQRGNKGRGSDEDAVKPASFVPPEEIIAEIVFGPEVRK